MIESFEGYSILGFHRNRVAGCPRPFARPPAVKFAPCEPRMADRSDATNLHAKELFPNCLKRFFRFAHVSRAVFEAGEFFEEGELNFADGAVALFGDD
jgi:hypothetical protein